ncbi:MAG: GldM family protein [Saprospiraceae bacterium]
MKNKLGEKIEWCFFLPCYTLLQNKSIIQPNHSTMKSSSWWVVLCAVALGLFSLGYSYPLQETTSMSPAHFKLFNRVDAVMKDFDFNAKCYITQFELIRVGKRSDPAWVTNHGASFSTETRRLVQMAAFGDIYYFDDIRARCPGDFASRTVNSIVVKIQ